MAELRVSRVETQPRQTFGVVIGRAHGVSSYALLPRDDCRHYRDELEQGREVTLDLAAWRISRVADGAEQLGG